MQKRTFLFLLFFAILCLSSPLFCNQNENSNTQVVHYDIIAEIIPSKQFLTAKTRITIKTSKDDTKRIQLFLHKDFKIKNILDDIQSLNFTIDQKSSGKLMYSPTALPVEFELLRPMKKNEERIIEIDYSLKSIQYRLYYIINIRPIQTRSWKPNFYIKAVRFNWRRDDGTGGRFYLCNIPRRCFFLFSKR